MSGENILWTGKKPAGQYACTTVSIPKNLSNSSLSGYFCVVLILFFLNQML
jgi:hypothetical protein